MGIHIRDFDGRRNIKILFYPLRTLQKSSF